MIDQEFGHDHKIIGLFGRSNIVDLVKIVLKGDAIKK